MSELRHGARMAVDLRCLFGLGFSVPDALARVRRSAPPEWQAPLQKAESAARAGSTLRQALRAAGGFPELLVEGLSDDDDPIALARVARLLEDAERRQSQVRIALSYPIVLLVTGLVVTWIVYGCMGAAFSSLFANMSLHLPLITQINILVAKLVTHPLFVTLEILLVGGVYTVLGGRFGTAGLRLRLPFVGPWIRRNESVTWLGWLEHFLQRGMPLPEAMRHAAGACGDSAVHDIVREAAREVERGDDLGKAIAGKGFLTDLGVWLVSRGQLREFPPGYLEGVAATLRRELDLQSERGLAWMEILGMLAMLMIIPPIVLGFFLPLYQLIGNL